MADVRSEELIDEDDWVEIERASKWAPSTVEASVKIAITAPGRFRAKPKARASILLRGKAAEWIAVNGPRFRIAIGGAKANCLRIVPDIHRGKFEAHNPPGATDKSASRRFNLGVVTAWPKEDRPSTTAQWDVANGWMRLRLPDDFARPHVAPAAAPKISPAAVTGHAVLKAVDSPANVASRRSSEVIGAIGDPAPGRSALDQRRAARG